MRTRLRLLAASTVLAVASSADAANVFRDLDASPVVRTSVSLVAGATYTIETSDLASGVDTVLHVWGPDASGVVRTIASNDDYPGSRASRVTFVAPRTGSYDVVVHAFAGTTQGTGNVKLNGAVIATGAYFGGTRAYVPTGNYRYESALAPAGSTDTMLYALDCSGALVGSDDDGGVGYASRFSATNVCSVIVASYSAAARGGASLYANDYTADADGDGLGVDLERALGTCDNKTDAGCSSVALTTDTDRDGLPDAAEVFGIDDPSQPQHLPRWGANPRHKDMFVEVDFVAPLTGVPWSDATSTELAKLFGAGSGADLANPDGLPGIRMHFDVGIDPTSASYRTAYGNWGGSNLSSVGDYSKAPDTQRAAVRAGVFRYALATASGGGQGFGDRLGWGTASGVGALAHELGHTAGLAHHGHDAWGAMNDKPNYPSIMNYAFPYTAGYGFSLGKNPSILDPSGASETTSFPSYSSASYLTAAPFTYAVSPAGAVDFNRDGVQDDFFAAGNTGGVRAGVTWRDGGDNDAPSAAEQMVAMGSKYKWDPNTSTGKADPRPITPRLVRFSDRMLTFWVDATGSLRYRSAAAGGPDPKGSCGVSAELAGPCMSFGGEMVVPTAEKVTGFSAAEWKGGVMFAYTTPTGGLRTLRATGVTSNGQLTGFTVETAEAANASEPELGVMYVRKDAYAGDEQLGLFWVQGGVYRWAVSRPDLTFWQRGEVRRTDGTTITGLYGASVVTWPSRELSINFAVSGRSCGAFVKADKALVFACYDKDLDAWQDLTSTMGPGVIQAGARPSLAYHVFRDAQGVPLLDQTRGQFWMAIPATGGRLALWRSSTLKWPTPPSTAMTFRWAGNMGNQWAFSAAGAGVHLFEDGETSALKALWVWPTFGVWFYPFVDGTVRAQLKDGNDFQVMEHGICNGLRGGAACGPVNAFGY